MKNMFELLGWVGAALVVLAYALVSFSVIAPTNIWYQVMSGVGSLGIVFVAVSKKDRPSATLNIVWALIALAAILRIVF
jgi:hypothetical protein